MKAVLLKFLHSYRERMNGFPSLLLKLVGDGRRESEGKCPVLLFFPPSHPICDYLFKFRSWMGVGGLHFFDQDIFICLITLSLLAVSCLYPDFLFSLILFKMSEILFKQCEGVLLVCQCCSLRLQFFFVILGLDFPRFCTVITLSPPYSFDYRIYSISLFRILKSIS